MTRCRHFLGMFPDNRPQCTQGWDVRKWAILGNGGSDAGIGLRLPCTKQEAGAKPLFDCPSADRKTEEEVEEDKAETRRHINEILAGMAEINAIKLNMISSKKPVSLEDCPWCGTAKALQVSCAVESNNHIHCRCNKCGKGIME